MKTMLALVAVVGMSAVTALLAGAATAGPAAGFYWSSYDANSAVENSDWGDARGVEYVTCRGLGDYKKEYGTYSFKRFRCELENREVNRIGFVTIYTTGPESWKAANFIKPRC